MGSYVEKVLSGKEEVVYEANLHWITVGRGIFYVLFGYFAGSAISSWVGTVIYYVGIIGGILDAISGVFAMLSTEFAVTTRRVITKTGLISRNTNELNNRKVEGVNVSQGILGRLLGYGTVTVTGTGGSLAPMKQVSKPLELRREILAQCEDAD